MGAPACVAWMRGPIMAEQSAKAQGSMEDTTAIATPDVGSPFWGRERENMVQVYMVMF